jgi:hypothetical protein
VGYLRSERYGDVGSRGRAALYSWGLMIPSLFACIASGWAFAVEDLEDPNASGLPALAGLCLAAFAFFFFAANVVLAWALIYRSHKLAGQALASWRAGDLPRATDFAQRSLRIAFRGDRRVAGFHQLALCAEAGGAFEEAAMLFSRTREAMPVAAAPIRKKRASILIDAHRAIALLALRRNEEAYAAIVQARALAVSVQPGLLDAIFDDASWGTGFLSLNEVLDRLEGGRDPLAILGLADAIALRAHGDFAASLSMIEGWRTAWEKALLPREKSLVAMLEADVRARMSGAYRAPGSTDPGAPWAALVLGL